MSSSPSSRAARPRSPATPRTSARPSTPPRGHGWVTQASLSSATRTPLDFTANTRLRTRTTVTDLQNRLIHLQYGDIVPTPTANGTLTPGAWEHVLANGRYAVTVSVGDQPGAAKTGCPAPCYDSQHTVRAEGVRPCSTAFQATAATEYRTGTATVDVTDGRLTVDAIGGTNTKMNWLTIASAGPVAPDTTPPAAPPSACSASPATPRRAVVDRPERHRRRRLQRLPRRSARPSRPAPRRKVNTSLVTGTSFTDTGLTNGTTVRLRRHGRRHRRQRGPVASVGDGHPGDRCRRRRQPEGRLRRRGHQPPAGYLLDYGQPFGAPDQRQPGHRQLSYGWVSPAPRRRSRSRATAATATPTAPSANEPDARLATLVHMQYAGQRDHRCSRDASWELAVPNGAYPVTVDVGDAGTAVDSSLLGQRREPERHRRLRPDDREQVRHRHPDRHRHRRPAHPEPGRRHQHQDRPTSTSPRSTGPTGRTPSA